jgi:NADPH2:quinone reductase
MKAVQCHEYGMPETLSLDEIDAPVAKSGEVLVQVRAAALNFPDVLMIQGMYQSQPPFPFIPGGEFAGDIVALGDDVKDFQVGDAVFGGSGVGAMAETLATPAAALRRKPAGMSYAQASGISTTYGTSYYALKQRADLKPGETLLVTGAGGGVGLAAVELGKAMGARVIAAASSQDKLNAAGKAGADEFINYSKDSLKDQVKAMTGGKGADVIYDPVGGDLFDQCMRSIGWYGRVLVIGFAAGDIPKLPINLVLLKSCQVVGVFFGSWSVRFKEEAAQNFREILALYEDGKLDPLIGAQLPLAQYAEAMRTLMERRAIGKVVVTMENGQ